MKEAYEEFKHVLLALIYGKDDQSSPVANEVTRNKLCFGVRDCLTLYFLSLHVHHVIFIVTVGVA